jgi:hypothetical protein
LQNIDSHFASVTFILGNPKLLGSIKSFCFGYSYFWQLEVSELLLNHCASLARIFGNVNSMISSHIIVYIEIENDACGDQRLLTSFDLIKHVFADIREPYDGKAPLSAHVKCSYGEWML